MKKYAIALSVILSLLTASSAEACYTARELEAEQGLRIHSELMVIGLTCIKMPQGQALYNKYQAFTAKNANLIGEYETNLIQYYSQQGIAHPEQKFHTLRTDLANEISRQAIRMNTVTFCQKFASHLDQALSMDQQKIRRWAQHGLMQQPSSEPVCRRT